MNTEYERIKKWLKGFFNSVERDGIELLPLYTNRIYFFPEGDKENSINIALDDLDEMYASKDEIKKMRSLFEFYAQDHKV